MRYSMRGMTEEAINELAELIKSGVHIGHRPSRRHPRMLPFIFGTKGTVEIIDVQKTLDALKKAGEALKTIAEQGKTVLFVGTKPHMRDLIEEKAKSCNMPYVTKRWLGGTLTNFKVIGRRLQAFRELSEMIVKKEEMEKYVKAEQVKLRRKYERMRDELEGIKELRTLPGALLLASLHADSLPAKEARMCNIPTIALVDSNADPSLVTYPIPGNDDALSSLRYLLGKLVENIQEGLQRKEEKTKTEK